MRCLISLLITLTIVYSLSTSPKNNRINQFIKPILSFSLATSFSLCLQPILPVLAVSGGGKDYANADLRGQEFTGQDLQKKDFTQCDATGVSNISIIAHVHNYI